jgi:hypothetical protein
MPIIDKWLTNNFTLEIIRAKVASIKGNITPIRGNITPPSKSNITPVIRYSPAYWSEVRTRPLRSDSQEPER